MSIRISWSALRTHEECKQKSHLARTHSLAVLDNKRNFFPGTVTDRVVRNWLNNDPLDHLGEMPDMVDAYIESEQRELAEKDQGVIRWRNKADREAVKVDCIEAVTKIEPDLLKYVVPFEYQPDFGFQTKIQLTHPRGEEGTVVLNGFMDILVKDDRGRYWVWDVKHTRDDGYWRKTIGQLGFYDLVVELEFGQPAIQTGLMQPLCTKTLAPYKPSADSRAQLLTRINAMAMDLWNDVRTPKESMGGCDFCPCKHACTKFKPVVDSKGRKRVKL